MYDLIVAIIYGIVEGITEWLPISSTGHMILLNKFLPLNVRNEFWDMFLVVIQLGAILAVIVFFIKRLIPWDFDHKTGKHSPNKKKLILWGKIILASIPAAIVGLFLDDYLNTYLYNTSVVSIMLILFGVIFLFVEEELRKKQLFNTLKRTHKIKKSETVDDLTVLQVIAVGLFQVIAACLPGTSRSGATIVGGLIFGISRCAIAEFTFFLAIPVMLGSSALKLFKFGFDFQNNELTILLVGMVTAFIVSIFVIKYFMKYIKKNSFEIFGYYRIILGMAVMGVLGLSFVPIA